MPFTTLSPTDIANQAISKVGAMSIQSLGDTTSTSAIQCNINFQLAYLSVARASRWNCLLMPAVLTQIEQTPVPGAECPAPSPAPAWAPFTTYQPNTFLTFGGYVYIVMYLYTSTDNFNNDLTTGSLVQTNSPVAPNFAYFPGGQVPYYPSGWAYQYALPPDFELLAILNDNECGWGCYGGGPAGSTQGNLYEIMQGSLFTNQSIAVIKYVQNTPDTTLWDPLFCTCVVTKLAAMIATPLRLDGGLMQKMLMEEYRPLLREARQKNAGEKMRRRFNLIYSSIWNAARRGGVNG